MKATVQYLENNIEKYILFDAADADTIKNGVAQWKINEKRIKYRDIQIIDIIFH